MIGCVMSCSEVIGLLPVLTEAATVNVFLLVRGALASRLALAAALELPEGKRGRG